MGVTLYLLLLLLEVRMRGVARVLLTMRRRRMSGRSRRKRLSADSVILSPFYSTRWEGTRGHTGLL